MKQKKQSGVQSSDPLAPQSKQKKRPRHKKENKNAKAGIATMSPQSPKKNQNFASENKGKKRNSEQMQPIRKKQKLNLQDSKGIAPSVNVKLEKFSTNKITLRFPRVVHKVDGRPVPKNAKEVLREIVQKAKAVYYQGLLHIETPVQQTNAVTSKIRKITIGGKRLQPRLRNRKLRRDPIRRVAFLAARNIDHEELREFFGAVSIEQSSTKKGKPMQILTFPSRATAIEADKKKFPYGEGENYSLGPRFIEENAQATGALTTKQPQTPQNKKQAVKQSDSAPGKRKRGSNGVSHPNSLSQVKKEEDEDDEEDDDDDDEDDDDDDEDDDDEDDE